MVKKIGRSAKHVTPAGPHPITISRKRWEGLEMCWFFVSMVRDDPVEKCGSNRVSATLGRAVRLSIITALAYNLGNLLRTLARCKAMEAWSLAGLRELVAALLSVLVMSP